MPGTARDSAVSEMPVRIATISSPHRLDTYGFAGGGLFAAIQEQERRRERR